MTRILEYTIGILIVFASLLSPFGLYGWISTEAVIAFAWASGAAIALAAPTINLYLSGGEPA